MRPRTGFRRLLFGLAFVGSLAVLLNALWQSIELVNWGLEHAWHFENINGWGFGWLLHLELGAMGLLLVAPFQFFRRNDVTADFARGNRIMSLLLAAGVTLFVTVSALGVLLQRAMP